MISILKIKARLGAIALLILALLVGMNATRFGSSQSSLAAHANYSATTCPASMGGSATIALPAKKLLIRSISPKSLNTHTSLSTAISASSTATYVQGTPGSPIAFDAVSPGASADVLCDSGSESQWFIGGTASLNSVNSLQVINGGLSDATVLIYPYTNKSGLAPIPLTIHPNSEVQVPVASLAPGESSVALNVVTQTGRVTSFLLDHRKQGLSDQGASYVAAAVPAATKVYLPGLVNSLSGASSSSKGGTTQDVRLLVPGNLDANVSGMIYSNNGSFAPVGLDQIKVSHQRVVDIQLPTNSISGAYGLVLTSDQPLLASVLTSLGGAGSDFAWLTGVSALMSDRSSQVAMNLNGSTPTLFFMGDSIAVHVAWVSTAGTRGNLTVSGNGSVAWKAPTSLASIAIYPTNKSLVYGGIILASGAGLNYLPIASHIVQGGSTLPIQDIRTLTHQ